ncbi:M14 family zinc carboxypeptidase [Collimonas sp. NPDC087041]|uniref:M14 family zinc carboxypeptidase n=1 Tax=Collimonas sp. NPDC087041 TaxID=3363960 RepID=UPI00382D1C16
MDCDLPELIELERIMQEGKPYLESRTVCEVEMKGHRFPVYALTIGSKDPEAPAVGFFGGVHGLERIGTRVLLSFLRSLLSRLKWDAALHQQLASVRLVFMPLVNPAGMWDSTRCNPRGVDLMRNAPVDASEKVAFMLGGQRFSSRLPWYRGISDAPMEAEAQALCSVVQDELMSREFSIALDCHSGFGLKDRIWFPYAHSRTPIPHLPQVLALKELFNQTYREHNYLFEAQNNQYLTHGDLWDYLYLQSQASGDRVFLPLTLEMGSWLWVRENPRQLFSRLGMFNPKSPNRLQRVLRSHLVWFEFLTRAAGAHRYWTPDSPGYQQQHGMHHE